MTETNALTYKLAKVKAVFNLESLLKIKPDNQYIQKYYRASKIGYSLFYSATAADRMYMGISRDGVFKDEDLLEAARIVGKYVKSLKATSVLELATGRGATSAYLAAQYPQINFKGIELSPAQLSLAKKKARAFPNYQPVSGDYHDLSRYDSESFDIVFVIEALCYSTDKYRVYLEVKRVLKKGGVLIVFDGYTEKSRKKMSREELLACKLTEKSMALNVFESHKSAIDKATALNLKLISDENVSEFILPTLRRFESHAIRYFRHPNIARFLNRFVPKKFIYNVIAGFLMPDVVGMGLLSYHITVLKK